MSIPIPSREEIFAAFIADYAAAQPSKNVARGSDPYRLGRVVSGTAWTVLAKLLFFDKQALPDTAQAAYLERWGNVYDFKRKAAQGSKGPSALRATGTIGNSITVGKELTHADGTLYKVTTVGAVVGSGGSVDLNIEAVSVGLATNKGIGEHLTFTDPDPGIDADTVLVAKLTDGLDIETYDDYRVRLLAHIGDPPEGGAFHDYIEWALSVDGVTTAYVWAHRRGMGTIDVAVLGGGTGTARIVSDAVQTAVDDYIDSVRPGNVRDFLVLTINPQAQDVEIILTDIDTDTYGWDWDDVGIGYNVSAANSTAKTITAAAPAGLVAGKRITVLGEEALVTNRVGNVLTLSFENDYDGNAVTWFSFNPVGQDVRASGDLVKPAKNAILALFNTLGPARSPYAETPWVSELKLSKLFGASTDVTGVDDAQINTPSSNVVPVDTYGDSVTLLVPRYIKIWKPA